MKKDQLLYYSFADLMIRVEYDRNRSYVRITSHRILDKEELAVVQQHLVTLIASEIEEGGSISVKMVYAGEDKQLVKDLRLFHLKNTINEVITKNQETNIAVQVLIDKSMTTYYFEELGDMIIELRVVEQHWTPSLEGYYLGKLAELIEAYNMHSPDKTSVVEVVPDDLQYLFPTIQETE